MLGAISQCLEAREDRMILGPEAPPRRRANLNVLPFGLGPGWFSNNTSIFTGTLQTGPYTRSVESPSTVDRCPAVSATDLTCETFLCLSNYHPLKITPGVGMLCLVSLSTVWSLIFLCLSRMVYIVPTYGRSLMMLVQCDCVQVGPR